MPKLRHPSGPIVSVSEAKAERLRKIGYKDLEPAPKRRGRPPKEYTQETAQED